MFNCPEIVDEALCQGVVGVEGRVCCIFVSEDVSSSTAVYSIDIPPSRKALELPEDFELVGCQLITALVA